MSELLKKIKLFRTLELKPISKEIEIEWMREIDQDLITTNNIKECVILIEKIDKWNRKLRSRKARKCCHFCVSMQKISFHVII